MLALAILFVLTFGILNVVKEDIEVAPFMHEKVRPDSGRLVHHTKNATRLIGGPERVGSQVADMVEPYIAGYSPPGPEESLRSLVDRLGPADSTALHLLVLPSAREHLLWSLPPLYFAAGNRSPIAFDNEPDRIRSEARGRRVFVPVPEEVIPDDALQGVPFTRVAGGSPAAHAVRIAEYRDEESGFGWGRTYDRRTGYFHYVVTTPSDLAEGLAALPLARTNHATLLYADDRGGVPAQTDAYIWSQRADWFVTPSESPFRHFFIVSDRISYAAQGRIDFSVEKSEYASYGPVALGPMEALGIVYLMLGLCGAFVVLFHMVTLLPEIPIGMQIAWFMGSLLLPILGPILYFSAYRRPVRTEKGMLHWVRPNSIRSAAATMMGFGYGAPLMIAIAYLFAFFGFPIFYPESVGPWTFWLGAGMPFMMIMMYILAVLIAWPLVQYPMKAMMMDMSRGKLLWVSLKVTALSMFFVSLGMMLVNWWMMMWHIRMMPKEDDILWFFSITLASTIGFLIAWPLNWILVRKKMKPGHV